MKLSEVQIMVTKGLSGAEGGKGETFRRLEELHYQHRADDGYIVEQGLGQRECGYRLFVTGRYHSSRYRHLLSRRGRWPKPCTREHWVGVYVVHYPREKPLGSET